MKAKKLIIIIAAIVVVLAVAAVAIFIFAGKEPKDNDDDNKVYLNVVDKYATGDFKSYVLVPERASEDGDSFTKLDSTIKVFEKFTLTEDEKTKLEALISSDKWHLMSDAKFSDPAAEAHFKNILAYSGLDLSYNKETTYYIIRTSDGNYVSASGFMPASSCQIAIFDTEDNSYYYVRFDI